MSTDSIAADGIRYQPLVNYTGVGILTNFPFVTGYLNVKSER